MATIQKPGPIFAVPTATCTSFGRRCARGRPCRPFNTNQNDELKTMLMKNILLSLSVIGFAITFSAFAAAQARPFPGPDVQQIYQRLLPQIEKIPAFDHHAHPGFADDPDVDAMADPPNSSAALRTRDDNPELIAAAKALFAYPYGDFSPDHAKWLAAKKAELGKQKPGTAYFDLILDKVNIESSDRNRRYRDSVFPTPLFSRPATWRG